MTHTPTPWFLVNGNIISHSLPDGEYVAAGEWEGQMVAFMHDGDAEFIVRACNAHDELLSASKNLLEFVKIRLPNYTGFGELERAIAKAEGN